MLRYEIALVEVTQDDVQGELARTMRVQLSN